MYLPDLQGLLTHMLAALGGGVFLELTKRLIPSKDHTMDLYEEREKRQNATEDSLRKALWDEIARLTAKLAAVENKLEQSNQLIVTLRAENVILKAEVELLGQRLGVKFNEAGTENKG